MLLYVRVWGGGGGGGVSRRHLLTSGCAHSNRRRPLASVYRRHEQEKKRQYEERVREVEHATFTPLVMSTTGGMGKAATTFYKRPASMISEKKNTVYTQTMNWIRCKLSFALLRASIMSIRGARSSRHHETSEAVMGPIDVQFVEGQIQGTNRLYLFISGQVLQ